MPDAARLAHAAGRNDDVEAVNAVDGLALLDTLREADPSGLERLHQVGAVPEFSGMPLEDGAGLRGQGRVDEDRDVRQFAGLHQLHEVDEKLLRPLDRERWDEQHPTRMHGRADLVAQHPAAALDGGAGAVRIAIGGFKEDVIEVSRPVRVRLQELVVGSDIAGEQEAHRLLVAAVRHLHLDGGRAQKMTRIPVAGPEAGSDILPLAVSHRAETA